VPRELVRCPRRGVAAAVLMLLFGSLPTQAEEAWTPVQIAQALGAADEPAAGEDEEAATGGGAIAPPPGVEVIRVRGRPLTAIETEVPESVTQFDAAAMEAIGAENVSDLAKVTPNVEIRTAGATAATFFIRGVGLSDFSANAPGAVAVYKDEVAMNAPALQLGQLFDLENVEVLRGPQGGGSGRNASAGAIKMYSRKPTGQLEAQLRTSLGAYESPDAHRALIQDYEGAVELPLVEEALATRLAFRLRLADPFMTNGCGDAPPYENRPQIGDPNPNPPPQRLTVPLISLCGERRFMDPFERPVSPIPEGLPTRVGDQGSWAARGQLRFQPPGTEMDWLLNLHGGRLDQHSTLGQAIGTESNVGGEESGFGGPVAGGYMEPDQGEELCRLRGGVYTRVPGVRDRDRCNAVDGQSLKPVAEVQAELEKNLAEKRPLDIGPYRGDYNRVGQSTRDTWGGLLRGDFALGPVAVTSISGYDAYQRFRDTDQDFTPDVLFEVVQEDEAWQFTQELRFSGELQDTPFRWQAGGYYLMEMLKADGVTTVDRFNWPYDFHRVYEQDLWSFAFYGSFVWDFLDDWTLEGGVRYNWERKAFDFVETQPQSTLEPDTASSQTTWWAPTGTLSLTYHIREDVSVYWKYARGFKSGHYNSIEARTEPARPEYIDAFETGLRGRWWDGRFGLGGAFFYYKYVDYQVFLVDDEPARPPTLEIINANDAEQYGGELDFRLEPLAGWAPSVLDGLVLSGRVGWLESQFLNFTDVNTRIGPTGDPFEVISDYSGNQLINAPRFKLSGAAEWAFDLERWGVITPRYDFAWSDDIFFDPSQGRGSLDFRSQPNKPEFAVGQPSFWLHNLRLGYRTPAGNMEIALWVRNLTDERYKTYAFDASFFSKVVINFVGEPRTIGLDLSVNW
jgi:outer membrane receptor protein involved in Fe transport